MFDNTAVLFLPFLVFLSYIRHTIFRPASMDHFAYLIFMLWKAKMLGMVGLVPANMQCHVELQIISSKQHNHSLGHFLQTGLPLYLAQLVILDAVIRNNLLLVDCRTGLYITVSLTRSYVCSLGNTSSNTINIKMQQQAKHNKKTKDCKNRSVFSYSAKIEIILTSKE